MSTREAKAEVVYDFLINRASLKRLTTHEEVGKVIGIALRNRGQRRIDTPVRREKVVEAIALADKRSWAENKVLVSAVVTHFFDNDPGHRFYETASKRGLGDTKATHKDQLRKLRALHSTPVPFNQEPVGKHWDEGSEEDWDEDDD